MPRKKTPGDAPPKNAPRKPLDQWDEYSRTIMKTELDGKHLKVKELAARLKNTGLASTVPKVVNQRIDRGSFNFGFGLRVLRACGVDQLDLEGLPDLSTESGRARAAAAKRSK
jgi:hypothetical protein